MHPVASSEIQDTQHLPGQHKREETIPEQGPLLGK